MSKTLVENKVCRSCGAEVRPGSLFCYNCGEAVAPEPATREQAAGKKTVKEAIIEAESEERGDFQTTRLDGRLAETGPADPIPKPGEKETPKLKSAASMRRKPKTFQTKTIEVVWEEPDNAPNKWFPLVAFFLVLFVFLIFYLAMYLK